MVTYIAHHADLKKQGEALSQFFSTLDKNGDHRLSKEELRDGFKEGGIIMSDKEFNDLFKKLDTSNSGSISYTEYLAGAIDLEVVTNEKYLEEAFNFFGGETGRFIDKEKLMNAMKKGWLSEVQLAEAFVEFDTNKDDKITFPEFKKAMQEIATKKKVVS